MLIDCLRRGYDDFKVGLYLSVLTPATAWSATQSPIVSKPHRDARPLLDPLRPPTGKYRPHAPSRPSGPHHMVWGLSLLIGRCRARHYSGCRRLSRRHGSRRYPYRYRRERRANIASIREYGFEAVPRQSRQGIITSGAYPTERAPYPRWTGGPSSEVKLDGMGTDHGGVARAVQVRDTYWARPSC